MASLISLCDELLHEIFILAEPADLARLTGVCRTFNTYIKGNTYLWKDAFTRRFDEPPKPAEYDWEHHIRDASRVQSILQSDDEQLKRANLPLVINTIVDLVELANKNQAKSLNLKYLEEEFDRSALNRNVFLFSSELYGYTSAGEKRAGTEDQYAAPTSEERQLSAKLHTYFGTCYEGFVREVPRPSHPYARSRVYDLRNYNDHNSWGPYLDDRSYRPDWEKMESIMINLAYSMHYFWDGLDNSRNREFAMYNSPFRGITPYSYEPVQEFVCPGVKALMESGTWKPRERQSGCPMHQPQLSLDARDPYGVSGTWRRIVCFLDYNDLYAFNFLGQDPPNGEMRGPITTQEAARLISMKIRVTRIEEPGPEDGQGMPVVHFAGTSKSLHANWDPNANSKLTGTVRMTPNGDVRWTTLSIFHRETRWRSESIQLGGIKSARGVIGTWFDKDYDPNGPAGPTAFWKVCEPDQGHVWDDEVDDYE